MKKTLAILCMAAVILLSACGNTAANTTAADTSADTSSDTSSDTSADTSSDTGTATAEVTSSDLATETAPTDTTAAVTTEAVETTEAENVKYVLGEGVTQGMINLSRYNEGNKVRLASVFKKAKSGEDITVAFIGGSITQGTSAGSEQCYAKLTADWLQEQFPDIKVNYVNAGIGATGSYIGVHRADEDVLSYNPDLVFIEFSVNDTTEATERNKASYDSLIRKLWFSATSPAVVTIATTQENGTSFQEQHGEIVKAYDIPMISYKNAILDVIEKGDIAWKDISDDDIHPNVPGHAIVSQLITAYLGEVIADMDNISGAESDLSAPYTSAQYENAELLRASADAAVCNGFELKAGAFGGFNGFWKLQADDGKFNGASLKFEVEAKTIGLLYGKLVSRGGSFNVLVDGEVAETINTAFPGGWGNYVECVDIYSFAETGKHTVEIVPLDNESGEKTNIVISALAIG